MPLPTRRSLAARAALALWPPDRLLSRPDPVALATIRFGLGLADEPPEDLESRAFAPLARRRLGQPDGRHLAGRIAERLQHVGLVLAALDRAGIPVMPLKGLAMVLFVYRDLGVRPMADVDLLVPPERLPEAREALGRLGFAPRLEDPRGLATAPGHVDHSVALRHPAGVEIDLHYCALDECRWPGADDGLWRRSQERSVLGASVRVASPTDLLFHLLGHGYRVQRPPRWVADAGAVLLDRREAIDWSLLVDEAVRRRMVLPLSATLRCLREDLGIPVDDEALARLDEAPLAAWEPFDFWVRSRAKGRLAERLFLALADYLRLASGQGEPLGLSGFARFLATRWAVQGSLAGEIARRARDVLSGRPARRPAGGPG